MDDILAALRAAAEPTRLRLLYLCVQRDLTVSELVRILGQSQPRVSRHLKVMVDAGLLARYREGSWVYYRAATDGRAGATAKAVVSLMGADEPDLIADLDRLEAIRQERSDRAAAYFSEHASQWNVMRSLHGADAAVEQMVVDQLMRPRDGGVALTDFLDVGTGTGRILELMAPHVQSCVGVDQSIEMLSVARANLDDAGLRNVHVRQADMYHLPFAAHSFDRIAIHQVLHFADDPEAVLNEAGRVLRPGGVLALADLNPHDCEDLRDLHSHRRLGFQDQDVRAWLKQAGLSLEASHPLPGERLSVTVWVAGKAIDGAALPVSVSTPALSSVSPEDVPTASALRPRKGVPV